jgi:hypothetical protein
MSAHSSAESVPGPDSIQPSNKWAWLLAFSPVVFWIEYGVVQFANLGQGSDNLITLALYFAILPIALLDSGELRKVGIRLSVWWWFFLVPLYLLLRARKLHHNYVLLVVWIGSFILSLLLIAGVLAAVNKLPL